MPRAIPEDRFQALIDAATAVFLEQGYRRTQVADVAARMDLAKGSVYTYVESKEALFHCVLEHADRPDRIELPETLPVLTPPPEATLEVVERRLAEEGTLPALTAALSRVRVADVRAELESVLGELYDALARHRTAIKILDRCAPDYPELAKALVPRGSRGITLAAGPLLRRPRPPSTPAPDRGALRRIGLRRDPIERACDRQVSIRAHRGPAPCVGMSPTTTRRCAGPGPVSTVAPGRSSRRGAEAHP
jgi:AcrR family transcriptional regulator